VSEHEVEVGHAVEPLATFLVFLLEGVVGVLLALGQREAVLEAATPEGTVVGMNSIVRGLASGSEGAEVFVGLDVVGDLLVELRYLGQSRCCREGGGETNFDGQDIERHGAKLLHSNGIAVEERVFGVGQAPDRIKSWL
jgi:hypothetical protein